MTSAVTGSRFAILNKEGEQDRPEREELSDDNRIGGRVAMALSSLSRTHSLRLSPSASRSNGAYSS
jgi:hypothetical protein